MFFLPVSNFRVEDECNRVEIVKLNEQRYEKTLRNYYTNKR